MQEFWIGDRVKLKKSKRIGKYDGMKPNGKHRVILEDKTILTNLSNLIKLDDERSTHSNNRKVFTTYHRHFESDVLDLHISVINPSLEHSNPIQIREYQIRVAREFIDFGLRKGWKFATIVHGRGTGVLRSEVHHMLRLNEHVKGFHLTNNDGATEVLFW